MASTVFQPIRDAIARLVTVKASTIEFIRLANERVANAPTLEEAQAIMAELDSHSTEIAAALVAGTTVPPTA